MKCTSKFGFCILLLLMLQAVVNGQETHSKIFYRNYLFGKWVIYKYIFGDISNWGPEESNKFLSTDILFSKNNASFFEETVSNPVYSFPGVDIEEYLYEDYREYISKLHIKDDFLILCQLRYKEKLSNTVIKHILDVIILKNGEIVVPYQGNYFFLRKM